MYLLSIPEACSYSAILQVFLMIKKILNVVQILIPVILILLGMFDFFKALAASDEKNMSENKNKFFRRIIAGVIIFFIPAIVKFSFNLIQNIDFEYSDCWNAATSSNIKKLKKEEIAAREAEKAARKEKLEAAANNTLNDGANNNLESSTDDNDKKRQAVVSYAKMFIGHPYVWGGTTLCPNWKNKSGCGVDCSGFVKKVYEQFGYRLPHNSSSQASYNKGKTVELSEQSLKPGDLIFYGPSTHITHVVIYIGNGRVIHASSPSTGVKYSKFNSGLNYTNNKKAIKAIRLIY